MADLQQPGSSRAKNISMGALLALAIVAPAEGLRQKVYVDPVGIPTYCFGETRNPDPTKVYSIAECKDLLNRRVTEAIEQVDKCVPGLPVSVLAAFGSAVYNMGPTIACNQAASTAARYLHDGKLIAACNELPKWDKARKLGVLIALPGLTKRRAVERDACLAFSAQKQ